MQNLEKHVNFENENSRKAYYREFKKVCFISKQIIVVLSVLFKHFDCIYAVPSRGLIVNVVLKVVEASDVILEVLDVRDPFGCRCPQVEQAVIQSGTNKKIVLVLNKIGRFLEVPVEQEVSPCSGVSKEGRF